MLIRPTALISLIIIAKALQTFSYSVKQLLSINPANISRSDIEEIWLLVMRVNADRTSITKLSQTIVNKCCSEAVDKYGLLGFEDVGRRDIPSVPIEQSKGRNPLSEEFIAMVDYVLPIQPWKPGVHSEVAAKLDCKPIKVSRTIQQLIADGKRNFQRNGVVYDSNGNILAVDSDRVPESPNPPNL